MREIQETGMERSLVMATAKYASTSRGRRRLAMALSLLLVASMSTGVMAADGDEPSGPDDATAAGTAGKGAAPDAAGSDGTSSASVPESKPVTPPATPFSATPKPPAKVDTSKIKYMSKDEDDVIFNALDDEMARSVERLKIGAYGLPYFVQYKVLDTDMYYMTASYGAISSTSRSKLATYPQTFESVIMNSTARRAVVASALCLVAATPAVASLCRWKTTTIQYGTRYGWTAMPVTRKRLKVTRRKKPSSRQDRSRNV
jgi:hypothetical protein